MKNTANLGEFSIPLTQWWRNSGADVTPRMRRTFARRPITHSSADVRLPACFSFRFRLAWFARSRYADTVGASCRDLRSTSCWLADTTNEYTMMGWWWMYADLSLFKPRDHVTHAAVRRFFTANRVSAKFLQECVKNGKKSIWRRKKKLLNQS